MDNNMRKGILMSDNDPTDRELILLMKEAGQEARERGIIIKQLLKDKLSIETAKAKAFWKK
jgi:hypothetical protein